MVNAKCGLRLKFLALCFCVNTVSLIGQPQKEVVIDNYGDSQQIPTDSIKIMREGIGAPIMREGIGAPILYSIANIKLVSPYRNIIDGLQKASPLFGDLNNNQKLNSNTQAPSFSLSLSNFRYIYNKQTSSDSQEKNIKKVAYTNPALDNISPNLITLNKCHISNNGNFIPRIENIINARHIDIQNSTLDNVWLNKLSSKLIDFTNVLGEIKISNSNFNSCNFFYLHKTNEYNSLIESQFNKIGKVAISNSKHSSFSFKSDSIENTFSISDTIKSITFSSCEINFRLDPSSNCHINKISFLYCSFGESALIGAINCDTIEFIGCGILPSQLKLLFTNQSRKTVVIVFNTDFTKTGLWINKNVFIQVPPELENSTVFFTSKRDIVSNLYESFLLKFKSENKYSSYKIIDLQYRKFKSKTGNWLDKTAYFFEKIWWNFGYSKFYILYWVMGSLLFFFLFNKGYWKHINSVYPFQPPENSNYSQKGHNKNRESKTRNTYIFIYTAFIFFAISIKFERLSFQNRRWLLWFFVQYLWGLWCVIFIARALLKF